ncbi:hypothetical protein K3495_g8441 [Podosphaera aphanis]|nr:hypothetical protein K3495_g8441 [Podosphaera aphanis]
MVQNKSLIITRVPTGFPVPGEDLSIKVGNFDLSKAPPMGGLIVRHIYAALEPYQRTLMSDDTLLFKRKRLRIGCSMTGLGIARVLKTSHPGFHTGQLICGMMPIKQYSVVPPEKISWLMPLPSKPEFHLTGYLGILGLSGLAAYGAMSLLKNSQEGDVIYISAAAGSVGHVAGQLAMRKGLKVFGSVGTDNKLNYIVNELGFTGGFNYKKETPLDALQRLVPNGIDVYFDNVGGEQLEAALEFIKPHGQIICCGMLSDYNRSRKDRYGIRNSMNMILKSITMTGFMVTNYFKSNRKEYKTIIEWLSKDLARGKLTTLASVYSGIESGPQAFLDMLKGELLGKTILEIGDL